MRRLAFLLLLAGVALPALAAQRVSVEQLEKVLTSAEHRSDSKAAKTLSGLQLTERFSAARLAHWESALPGPKSRRALLLLADVSAFLDPPASQIPAKAPPDFATQRHIIALTIDYVAKTVRQLPNLFATQDTIHFEDMPARQGGQGVDGTFIPCQPMHPVSRSSVTVMYFNGREIVDRSGATSGGSSGSMPPGLTTGGEFGPILTTVLVDAAHGTLAWSRWEHGPKGLVAVFRFSVPRDQSHYQVEFCCIAGQGNGGVYRRYSAYHGEMTVDPADGTILRLTVIANLMKSDPVVKSNILVEYGPISIGGKTYICPTKSISMSLSHIQNDEMLPRNVRGALFGSMESAMTSPLQAMLNEVEFKQYHLFRARTRILTVHTGIAGRNAALAPAAGADKTDTTGAPEKQEEAAESTPPVTTPENRSPVVPETPVAPGVASHAIIPPSVPAVPEFNVAAASDLPELSGKPLGPGEKHFILHVTARLVDVSVVALDKKGHPVTDLKAGDFEIFDNGRKQAVQLFGRAIQAPAAESAPAQSGHAADQFVVSNRPKIGNGTRTGVAATEASETILLIDANSLAWADLNYARSEMLKFLQKLPAGERVGLYVQSGPGFQILQEGTSDHALLASTLRRWMPSAQALAGAQEMEQRNRQQFDYVENQSDLQYVNGNMNTSPDTASPVDPKLRRQGSDPARNALSVLVGVARHVGALPGHKNVVWVASDNALVNWNFQAVNDDKGSQHLEGPVMRAQEALNDAHASVYPLDASQLETMAVDASLANLNVEVSPGVTGVPRPQGGGPGSGRAAAELMQDTRSIEPALQELATATGGRSFRRSGAIAKELASVAADAQATYLLGFSPDMPADGKYHRLKVKLTSRRGVRLRYRTGYLYSMEPSTLKDRFRQAIWQPFDVNDIAVSARPMPASTGTALKLNIATHDLALRLEDKRWTDKLDIFLVKRDDEGMQAQIAAQTLGLKLKPATYHSLMGAGIPFDEFMEKVPGSGSVRILVVDENSGRMGSITIPAAMFHGKS